MEHKLLKGNPLPDLTLMLRKNESENVGSCSRLVHVDAYDIC